MNNNTDQMGTSKASHADMVGHIYNPNTWEAKAGGLKVWEHPELHGETLFQKPTRKKKENIPYTQ